MAPSWHQNADSTSAWRRANIQTRNSLRRGAQLKSRHGFHFGVAPSWHTDADSISTWRRAGIRTQITLRRSAELESGREFNLEQANERRFLFGAALS